MTISMSMFNELLTNASSKHNKCQDKTNFIAGVMVPNALKLPDHEGVDVCDFDAINTKSTMTDILNMSKNCVQQHNSDFTLNEYSFLS